MKRPRAQLHAAKWLTDTRVSMCSPCGRFVYLELATCGLNSLSLKACSDKQLGWLCGATESEISEALREMEVAGLRKNGILQKIDAIRFLHQRPFISRSVKAEVFERDGGACVRCNATERLHYDHVYPYSLGGTDTASNIQLLCRSCNSKKGARIG